MGRVLQVNTGPVDVYQLTHNNVNLSKVEWKTTWNLKTKCIKPILIIVVRSQRQFNPTFHSAVWRLTVGHCCFTRWGIEARGTVCSLTALGSLARYLAGHRSTHSWPVLFTRLLKFNTQNSTLRNMNANSSIFNAKINISPKKFRPSLTVTHYCSESYNV